MRYEKRRYLVRTGRERGRSLVIPVLKKRCMMQPAEHGSKICRYPDDIFLASTPETTAIRLCDGSHVREEIEELCRREYPAFEMDWQKFSIVLDWQRESSDPDTTTPQLRSFDRQMALKRDAPSPWPWAQGRMPYISTATFFLTGRCNHQCTYCLKDCGGGGNLSNEIWLDALDQLLDLGLQYLLIRGGEPVLHPVFWPLMRRALENGVCVALQTNGALWQEEDINRLAVMGLDAVYFHLPSLNSSTYDTVTRSNGDLSRALRNLGRFHDRGIYVRVNTVLTSDNTDSKDISALVRYCYDLGVEQIRLSPFVCTHPTWEQYIPSGNALQRVSELIDRTREARPDLILPSLGQPAYLEKLPENLCPCGGVRERLVFLPDGGITFCTALALVRRMYIFGNLQTDRIRELWYSDRVDEPNGLFFEQEVCQFCEYIGTSAHSLSQRPKTRHF